jgi:hypothetical protein
VRCEKQKAKSKKQKENQNRRSFWVHLAQSGAALFIEATPVDISDTIFIR